MPEPMSAKITYLPTAASDPINQMRQRGRFPKGVVSMRVYLRNKFFESLNGAAPKLAQLPPWRTTKAEELARAIDATERVLTNLRSQLNAVTTTPCTTVL